MNIEFLSGFEKDLSLILDKILAKLIIECIEQFENANKISDVPNIKKLKGHSSAFRYRKGNLLHSLFPFQTKNGFTITIIYT
jgi:mRNA interferase RelE/StbE